MLLDLLSSEQRAPAECIVKIDGEEVSDLYPFLTEVTVETSRRQAAVADLKLETVRDENGRWSVQDAGILAPWKSVLIEAAFGGYSEEVMSGYIRQVESGYPAEPGTTTVTVKCQDESLALDREHPRTAWGADAPMADGDIATAILAKYGLALHPDSDQGLSGRVLNQDTTDIRFLRSRAEANGFELIFQQGLVYFGPLRIDSDPQATIMVYAGADTNCIRFSASADGHKPDKVAFDLAATEGAESVERIIEPDLPLLGPEPADSGSSGLGEFTWRMTRQGAMDEEETAARALRMANENALKIHAEGELDGSLYGHVLRVGEPVPVDGAGDWMGGTYYVDTVSHRFSVDGYRETFRLLRNAYGDNLESGGSVLAGIL